MKTGYTNTHTFHYCTVLNTTTLFKFNLDQYERSLNRVQVDFYWLRMHISFMSQNTKPYDRMETDITILLNYMKLDQHQTVSDTVKHEQTW